MTGSNKVIKNSYVVVAEGDDNIETLDQQRQLGCDQAQGYLFSKPIPAEKRLRK